MTKLKLEGTALPIPAGDRLEKLVGDAKKAMGDINGALDRCTKLLAEVDQTRRELVDLDDKYVLQIKAIEQLRKLATEEAGKLEKEAQLLYKEMKVLQTRSERVAEERERVAEEST